VVILEISGVCFRYGSVEALNDVSFSIDAGEVVSVIGPNGSGKTTLLKVIDGIVKPVRGAVYVDGRSLGRYSRRSLAKIVGYVPQRLNIQPLTLYDFVLSGRRPHYVLTPTARDREKVVEALKSVDLLDKADRKLTELSGGELQRAVIARALASEPKVLLLDEPTANLDLRYQVEVLETIRKLTKSRGITAVMALHDLSQAMRYSDKVIVLHRGKVYALGAPEEVINEKVIEAVYGVRATVLRDLKAIVVL